MNIFIMKLLVIEYEKQKMRNNYFFFLKIGLPTYEQFAKVVWIHRLVY